MQSAAEKIAEQRWNFNWGTT